jgi:hypothetical protein
MCTANSRASLWTGTEKTLEAAPMSNHVIPSRIIDISCNILKHVIGEMAASPFPFSMQLDATTDISQYSQFLVFVRYVHVNTTKEEFLFFESLLETTRPSLWSSGQSSWLQIQNSRRYQIF